MDSSTRGRDAESFSEKIFYLNEFRGRTLAIAAPAAELRAPGPLEEVLVELEANRTRVVLISTERDAIEKLLATPVLEGEATHPGPEGVVWRALRRAGRVGMALPEGSDFARGVCSLARRLGPLKLVWLDPAGGLLREDGTRISFLDLAQLRTLPAAIARPRGALLREVEAALVAGLPAVNLCTSHGLSDELFSYAGSGTLFTRDRYLEVRRLSIDDFDAADDLFARGVAEGYLAPRTPREIEAVLSAGFGAFVEGRHLAGIGALLHHAPERAGEIASLYTLTRFLGEGVGAHLVQFAVERAISLECEYVFACTTSERVVGFFGRQDFREVSADQLPRVKWTGYDPERMPKVRCLRRELR